MTEGFGPWRPHAQHAAPRLFSQMLPDAPQRKQLFDTGGWPHAIGRLQDPDDPLVHDVAHRGATLGGLPIGKIKT